MKTTGREKQIRTSIPDRLESLGPAILPFLETSQSGSVARNDTLPKLQDVKHVPYPSVDFYCMLMDTVAEQVWIPDMFHDFTWPKLHGQDTLRELCHDLVCLRSSVFVVCRCLCPSNTSPLQLPAHTATPCSTT